MIDGTVLICTNWNIGLYFCIGWVWDWKERWIGFDTQFFLFI